MERNNQIIRILKIVYRLLKTRQGVSLKQICLEFRVHPKTARRDLKAIRESDFELRSTESGKEKFYQIEWSREDT